MGNKKPHASNPPMEVFNVKLPLVVLDQLRRQAEKEDRTAASLVRVFIKAGLDDRNRGGGIRANG
jgi:hypothetical protein